MTRSDYSAACARYLDVVADPEAMRGYWTRRHTRARQRWLAAKLPPSYRRRDVRDAAENRICPFVVNVSPAK